MRLNVSLDEISNGKLYDLNDMVKIDTQNCSGCSACCHGSGRTIIMNPFDVHEILSHGNMEYKTLVKEKIDWHLEEKIMHPHMQNFGEDEACGFLDDEGRCSIHQYRPGVCRLFPLGRFYEQKDFKYFYQPGECVKPILSKVKVKKWIGIRDYDKNKDFVLAWHDFIKALQWRARFIRDEQELEAMNRYLIDRFYDTVWGEDFYEDFYVRLAEAKGHLSVL